MPKKRILTLRLKREYWEAIRDGSKPYEYRLCSDYWANRLVDREYDEVHFWCGYPPATKTELRLIRGWAGSHKTTITHKHFGPNPVDVFAIPVGPLTHEVAA